MKLVLWRKNRKLRKLKFKCTRCGAVFIADLYPDCQFKFDSFLRGMTQDRKQQRFTDAFHSISSICPDCGEMVFYKKSIPTKINDGIEIT